MHKAHRAESGRHAAASPSRVSKFLAAGIAVAGATAIAAAPVSPVNDDIKIKAQAQERAVALTAAADPLVLLQNFFAESQLNLGYLGSNATNSYAAVAAAFADADLPGELSNILVANATNPIPLLTRLSQFGSTYGDDIQIAFFGREDDPTTKDDPTTPAIENNENYDGVFERMQLSFTEFQTLLTDLQNYDPPVDAAGNPTQGQFTNAAFELNSFFVFGVLDNLRPLITATPAGIVPLFSIPGDFLGGEVAGGFEGGLPGFFAPVADNPATPENEADPGARLDNLLNLLNEQTLVRAAVGPFQTSFFQVAQVLDDAMAAYEAGDTELAINELTNLPIRTVNAFVNGFAPSFSPGGEEWPSLLDPRQQQAGLFKYLAVDLPNQIITALGGTPVTPQVPPAPTTTLTERSGADVLSTFGPATVDVKVEPTPEVPAKIDEATTKDTAVLAGNTTVPVTVPAAGGTGEVIEVDGEGEGAPASTTPVRKGYKPGDGLKALKKAGDDFNKGVKSFTDSLKPKKKTTESEDKKADTDDKAKGDTDTKDDKPKSDDNDKKSEGSES